MPYLAAIKTASHTEIQTRPSGRIVSNRELGPKNWNLGTPKEPRNQNPAPGTPEPRPTVDKQA